MFSIGGRTAILFCLRLNERERGDKSSYSLNRYGLFP